MWRAWFMLTEVCCDVPSPTSISPSVGQATVGVPPEVQTAGQEPCWHSSAIRASTAPYWNLKLVPLRVEVSMPPLRIPAPPRSAVHGDEGAAVAVRMRLPSPSRAMCSRSFTKHSIPHCGGLDPPKTSCHFIGSGAEPAKPSNSSENLYSAGGGGGGGGGLGADTTSKLTFAGVLSTRSP